MTALRGAAHYDQSYFDKWYRHPQHRVKSAVELRRQVEFVVRMAEWVLGRPIRSVLDVGCGYGKYGVLAREYTPATRVDAIDIAPPRYPVYDHFYEGDLRQLATLYLQR